MEKAPPRAVAAVVVLALFACALLARPGRGSADPPGAAPGPAAGFQEVAGPGDALPDVFHPETQAGRPQPEPALGGRVIVHIPALPESLNFTTNNAWVTHRVLYEVHEPLVRKNWEHWELEPVLCTHWDQEDQLVLDPEHLDEWRDRATSVGEGDEAFWSLYGQLSREGADWRLKPLSPDNPLGQETVVPSAHVKSVERGTVFTFHLREGVKWHDGHVLDARDVHFSWDLYNNPEVDCDEKRFMYTKAKRCDIPDERTVRFFCARQHYDTLNIIGDVPLLPSHLYDLLDPDCADCDPGASLAERGRYVNENPHNHEGFIGLGPYRVTEYTQQYIEAERFEDYFDPENAGYVDVIRWRYIQGVDAAFQALINGELDWLGTLLSTQYFGEATALPVFATDFYKGYYYTGVYGYVGWNLYQPHLKDQRVRQALARCFDFGLHKRTHYKGLCNQVTGIAPFFSLGYDHDVEPYPFDLDRAREMLAEAGWYDRDGDGVIDKHGVKMEIELLCAAGSDTSIAFGRAYKEKLATIGVELKMVQYEFATMWERVRNRDFDACCLAWVPDLESDPEQIWHSRWGTYGTRGSNNSGLQDRHVDELIEKIQRTIDLDARMEYRKELHRYLYDLQPYLFLYNAPRKFACNKALRGVELVKIPPGYVIRRWYYPEGTPGTRPIK